VAPERTADQLLLLTADGRVHEFWPDASSPAVMPEVRTAQTGRQLTDRYRQRRGQGQGTDNSHVDLNSHDTVGCSAVNGPASAAAAS
jgi:hypothetical protein